VKRSKLERPYHLPISMRYVTRNVKIVPTIEFDIWVIPIEVAGLIGWNSVAIKELPIPMIGRRQKP